MRKHQLAEIRIHLFPLSVIYGKADIFERNSLQLIRPLLLYLQRHKGRLRRNHSMSESLCPFVTVAGRACSAVRHSAGRHYYGAGKNFLTVFKLYPTDGSALIGQYSVYAAVYKLHAAFFHISDKSVYDIRAFVGYGKNAVSALYLCFNAERIKKIDCVIVGKAVECAV